MLDFKIPFNMYTFTLIDESRLDLIKGLWLDGAGVPFD